MGGDGPPRGGTRGGRDQFDWEAVKSDKDREFYLGASVKASVGRWQKGRDILWYTRDKEGGPGGLADELAAVKAEEERLMQEALGLRPVTERRGATALDAGELKELLKRSAPEGGAAGGAAEDEGGEATRVKGVGYTKTAADLPGAGGPTRETLPGLGPAPPPQQYQQMQVQQRAVEPGRPAERTRRADSSSSSGSEDEAQRKARKRAKKDAKRAKKEAKRARADRSRSREPARRRSRSRSREPRRRERERSRDRSRDRSRSRDRRRDEPPRR